jgi:uncharacterized protein (DUF697 family)
MVEETAGSGSPEAKEVVATSAADTPPRSDTERDQLATKVVDRFSLYAGGAGLIPIPAADIAAVAAVQLQMVRKLSEIYGVPFSANLGKSLIASLAGVAIPASTAAGVGSALKGIPIVGTAVGALTMSTVSAGATYLIGRTFIQHFASGGTLLDFNPPDYREFIRTSADKIKSGASSHAEKLSTGAKTGAEKLTAGAKSGAEMLKSGAAKAKTFIMGTRSSDEGIPKATSQETASSST